jgi:hypothetical protein
MLPNMIVDLLPFLAANARGETARLLVNFHDIPRIDRKCRRTFALRQGRPRADRMKQRLNPPLPPARLLGDLLMVSPFIKRVCLPPSVTRLFKIVLHALQIHVGRDAQHESVRSNPLMLQQVIDLGGQHLQVLISLRVMR